jgi:hypothetical protein
MTPATFTSKKGKKQVVGVRTAFDTGKTYKGSGAKEAARAAKRKANGQAQVAGSDTNPEEPS